MPDNNNSFLIKKRGLPPPERVAVRADARHYYQVALEAFHSNHPDRYRIAYNNLLSAIVLNPTYVNAYYLRGVILHIGGDYLNAIHDFNQVIQLDSDNIFAYALCGFTQHLLGQYELAYINFQRALSLANPYDNLDVGLSAREHAALVAYRSNPLSFTNTLGPFITPLLFLPPREAFNLIL